MLRAKTDGIVIHRAEVFTPGDYHFCIERDGTMKVLLPLAQKAEHAVEFNDCTIAVAVFGDFAALEPGERGKPTQAQIDTCAALLRVLNAQYAAKLWACGHSELGPKGTRVASKLAYGHTCPGENFPLQQVIATAGCAHYPNARKLQAPPSEPALAQSSAPFDNDAA